MSDGIGFHTPDYDGNAPLVCRRIALPSYLWMYFNGAFNQLLEEYNWVQVGDMLIEDVIQAFMQSDADIVEGCMIGSVISFANEFLPDTVLVCDGASYAVADYPELAGVLSPSVVTGASFVVPDLRGRFVMGNDAANAYPLTLQGGEAMHTLTISEMPAHAHGYTTAIASVSTVVIPDEPSAIPSPSTTALEGGGQPHNNLPPFYVLQYGIVAK